MSQPSAYAGYIEIAAASQLYGQIIEVVIAGTPFPSPPNPQQNTLDVLFNSLCTTPLCLHCTTLSVIFTYTSLFAFLLHRPLCSSPPGYPLRRGILYALNICFSSVCSLHLLTSPLAAVRPFPHSEGMPCKH
ncbi:unnamed protein product [Ectocarpus sp. 12 AP-2014]